MSGRYDAVVVGAGPNGLAAAITLAQHGLSVHVVEAADEVGGACRTAELTLPGFHHDVGATVLPFGTSSRFFAAFGAGAQRVEFVHSDAPLAHPLDDGPAVLLERSVDDTASGLGEDAARYRRVFAPLTRHAASLVDQFLGPLRPPRHPLRTAAFGVPALLPASLLARALFRQDRARALFAGLAAHSMMPLESPASSSIGLVLGMVGHSVGWPVVRGGSGVLSAALAAHLETLGGTIETGRRVASLGDLPRLARGPPRPGPAPHRQHLRRRAAAALPAAPARLSVRPGCLQGGLGARRADPLAGRPLRAGRHRPPRRWARRDRRVGAGGGVGRPQ